MNSFLLFFNISGGEMLIIVIAAYLIFGPKKIPEIARMVGKGMNELRRATNDIRNEIAKETANIKNEVKQGFQDPLSPTPPPKKNPSPGKQMNEATDQPKNGKNDPDTSPEPEMK
jgi:TatA/E family protein of Tat protein translocase